MVDVIKVLLWLAGLTLRVLGEAIKFFFGTIWGLFLVFALAVVCVFLFTDLIKPEGEREMRSRDAVAIAKEVGFKVPAVTGEPEQDAGGKTVEQSIAVVVGKERDDYNTARAKECWAILTARWDEEGNLSLTLTSRSGITQDNPTNADALTLDDYRGCDIR